MLVLVLLFVLLCNWVALSKKLYSTNTLKGQANLRDLDAVHWKAALVEASEQNYTISGFYHVKDSVDIRIIEEHFNLLEGGRNVNTPNGQHIQLLDPQWEFNNNWSSLLRVSNSLNVNIEMDRYGGSQVGSVQALVGKLRHSSSKVELTSSYALSEDAEGAIDGSHPSLRSVDVAVGQISTLNRLHDHCSRSVAAGKREMVYFMHTLNADDDPKTSWLRLMNTFTVEYPSICLRAMLNGYVACGAENQLGQYR